MIKKILKKVLIFGISMVIVLQSTLSIYAAQTNFSDVEKEHWAYNYINRLRELKITDGIGNNRFGIGQTITKSEFAAFLVKLMDWEVVSLSEGSFIDNKNINSWYFSYIETAVSNGAIKKDLNEFYPDEPITRQEMSVMLVRSLGYDELAKQIAYLDTPFSDVNEQQGYITIARDLGIISGMGDGTFKPNETATREQAATMLVNMYSCLTNNIDFINGFYAINSSSQLGSIGKLDSVCFGWSRLELINGEVGMNFSSKNDNEYRIPQGYEQPYGNAGNATRMLMVAVDDASSANIINDASLRRQSVKMIAESSLGVMTALDEEIIFDGVLIDFETLKGATSMNNFNLFLKDLKAELDKNNKLMYVAIHPQRRAGLEYYDGYDYKTIGELSDKVILMAHDYNAKKLTESEMEQGITITPITPIEEIYYAISSICDPQSGVQDKSKIVLQISFDTAQWKAIDGKVTNQIPYRPTYEMLYSRIKTGVNMEYSKRYENPYITFYNDEDNTENTVWYEDERSVAAKISLAKLFGITDLSLWRLGTIPDYDDNNLNVLSYILKEVNR